MNAGTVRTDIQAGDITYQNIIDVMPFSNDVLIKEISGQGILDALEFGVRSLPEPTSRFPQVSGITFKIDTSINSTVVVDDTENFLRVDGERRVYDVKINGEDLDVNKNYTISSHSFILDGGDGYSMFTPCEITKTAFGIDNDVLIRYISENLGGVIPEQYNQTENRIKKTEGKIYDDEAIRYYYDKSSNNKLSGGAIAAIAIAPIAVLGIIIATIYFVKARNIVKIPPATENQYTIDKMESSSKIKG